MERGWARTTAAIAALGLGLAACGAPPATPRAAPPGRAIARGAPEVRLFEDRPPVVVVAREGDPYPAAAVAVSTVGLGDADAAAALAALVDARLTRAGVEGRVEIGAGGYRARVALRSREAVAAAADAIRASLLEPVRDDEVQPVAHKLTLAARRPFGGTPAVARCRGEAAFIAPIAAPTPASLEALRRAAHGTGRVAVSFVGPIAAGDAFAVTFARAAAWPSAAPTAAPAPVPAPPVAVVASREIPVGTARAILTLPVAAPLSAALAADALARPGSALGARLGALETPATVREITGAALPRGGCLTVSIDVAAKDAEAAAARVAPAAAATEELMLAEAVEATSRADVSPWSLARRARDPEESAERAAWWAITADGPSASSAGLTVLVGAAREEPTAPTASFEQALARARASWQRPVVEARARVEAGQGELWLLFGSPCGSTAEVEGDAGYGAVAAVAAARHAPASHDDVTVEPYVSAEAIGLVAHGPARQGETAAAHARRVASVAGRLFTTGALDPSSLRSAHADAFRAAARDDARVHASLASALAPGRPSLLAPFGVATSLGGASDAALVARARAILEGPLRVAVLANGDATQGEAARRELDRWIPRRLDEVRACATPDVPPAKAGTYAVEKPGGASAEVWIAAPLAKGREARAAAALLAAHLDGDGLAAPLSGLVREHGARVVGGPGPAAIVVRVVAPNATLDAAVEKTRAVLAQLRASGLDDQASGRAWQRLERGQSARAADPTSRLAELFTGAAGAAKPSADQVRELAKDALRDEALIVVAHRPARR